MKQLIAVVLAAWTLGSVAQAQQVLAIDGQGQTYLLDSITGTATFHGSTGLSDTNAMARFRDWEVYVASGNGGGSSTIYRVLFFPLQVTPVVTVPLGSIRAIAIGPPGQLYAVNDPLGTTGPDDLHLIVLAQGTAQLIGPIGFSGIEGLASFDPSYATLYAWDVGDGGGNGAGLITIDTSTGAGTDVNPAVGGTDAVQTLAHSIDQDLLYGARDELYVINPATGVPALVGSGGYADVRGMDFLSLDVLYICPSKVSSLGCKPYLQNSSGSASKSGSPPCTLVAGPVPGGSGLPGILIYSKSYHFNPFSTSFGDLCLGPFWRAGAFPSAPGGDAGFCNGFYSWDLSAIAASAPQILVGDNMYCQGWYRDPGFPPPGNANFTNVSGASVVP